MKGGACSASRVAARGDKEIGDRIGKVIGKLAEAIDSLKGAINVATSSPNATAVARHSSFGSERMNGRRSRPASASLSGNPPALRPQGRSAAIMHCMSATRPITAARSGWRWRKPST